MSWWCPTCNEEVSDIQVTYEEYHETCGTYLGEWQRLNDEEKIDKAFDFLFSMNINPNKYYLYWTKRMIESNK